MNIIERIKSSNTLENYIVEKTGFDWKNIGSWKDLKPHCPMCGGHNCARLSPDGKFFCFQCGCPASNIIQFRVNYENISYKEAVQRFAKELNIKKYRKEDIDWIGLRELASEYLTETLFTCQTKYQWRGMTINPMEYLIDYRKHTYESLLHFRVGFNDGGLVERLKQEYTEASIKASGLSIISEGCFTYPFMIDNEIKYFRIKDPNHLKKYQMPLATRSRDAIWYNQDAIKNGADIILCEGEDDVISLWEAGENAVGSYGNVTIEQINYLKTFELVTIYLAFDPDPEGQRDIERVVKNYENTNIFVFKLSDGKDIDQILRETDDKPLLVNQLKVTAETPAPEVRSIIKQKHDGYFILKNNRGDSLETRLTNWIGIVEAIVIQEEGLRVRKIKIKRGNYETIVYMDGTVLSNSGKFREFLLNNCNETCLFQGNDNDLNALVQYWGIAYNPKIVKETDCVGEIDEGFIADNVFISNESEVKPLTDGFLSLDDKNSIKIAEITSQAGSRAEIPYYPLTEPMGGIENFKERIFNVLVKNRNLKVGIAIGWLKATLWSKKFFQKYKFFPLLMIHGKKEGGKTVLSSWLMSMIGLGDVSPVSLRERGTTSVGLERRLSYYSSLPIFADDYRNEREEGQKFHSFFRNVFNRISASKGIKNDAVKIRQVMVRGCLLINGESSPTDAALNSRLVTFEVSQSERNDKYYYDIVKAEPDFAHIGFDWVKNRNSTYPEFIAKYHEIEPKFKKGIVSPRQAQVWSVAVAGALTEPYFAKDEEKICNFAIKLANYEIEQQKGEEIMGMLWEATDILHKSDKLKAQVVYHNIADNRIEVHLPVLLAEITGDMRTRKYNLPNNREVAKVLKQEPYIVGCQTTRVEGKPSWRWILDLDHEKTPAILKNMFEMPESGSSPEDL